eukprot:TRINITY_DN4245_c0_g1_i1.p1 TRINITY_DN4245_c0_g1~~TRINITY_DN4245_c0_g1_i1.p1  ORF type:complete len:607 (+),score=83.92 TRINITY_DN4245_c0_g1_i1:92-1912(+)
MKAFANASTARKDLHFLGPAVIRETNFCLNVGDERTGDFPGETGDRIARVRRRRQRTATIAATAAVGMGAMAVAVSVPVAVAAASAAVAVATATGAIGAVSAEGSCVGTEHISASVWTMARQVDRIVQISHVPREYTEELYRAFTGILQSGLIEEASKDCPLGMAVLVIHSLTALENRYGLASATEHYQLYDRLLRAGGYSGGNVNTETSWQPETHQSAAFPLLLGLRPARCFGLNLKIFVYDTPFAARPLICSQGMFASEVFVHRYLLNSECRTENPEEADLFFVPVYAACVMTKEHITSAEMDEFYTALVRDSLPYYRRREGMDHVFLWSSEVYDFPSWSKHIHNSVFLSVEAQPLDCSDFAFFSEGRMRASLPVHEDGICPHCASCFQPWKDALIPGFVEKWSVRKMGAFDLPAAQRRYTACYYGADSDYIPIYAKVNATVRNVLQELRGMPGVGIGHRLPIITEYFERIGQCHFCFVPKGLGFWSNRLYEVLFAGCIPVLLSDGIGLPFDEKLDWTSFSLKWPMEEVGPGLVHHLEWLLNERPDFVDKLRDNLRQKRCWFDYNSENPECSPYLAILHELLKRKRNAPFWWGRAWSKINTAVL